MHYGNRYINAEDAINEYIIRTSKQTFFIQKNSLLNFDTVQIGRNSSFLFEFCRLWTNINKKKLFNFQYLTHSLSYFSLEHSRVLSKFGGRKCHGDAEFYIDGRSESGGFYKTFLNIFR